MGFMDKLKNIFFEEEEEEEFEEPVAPKVEKAKRKDTENKEKLKDVIAKKVETTTSKLKKENDKDSVENFEEKMNFEDNIVEPKLVVEKPIQKPVEKVESVKPKRESRINTELIFDDEDFILDTKPKVKKVEPKKTEKLVEKEDKSNLYRGKETKNIEKKSEIKYDFEKQGYGKKEVVKPKTFTPSPIISPIYGILDKNYKKEEVKDNKEIRISSRPSRMDLDSVRNKAFGDLEFDLIGNMKDEEIKEEVDAKTLEKNKNELKKAKSNDDEKPAMERVTLGEADEYYNDLGLAYNTDYKDMSKDLNDGKVKKVENKKDKLEDNLFDLIESMYDREE